MRAPNFIQFRLSIKELSVAHSVPLLTSFGKLMIYSLLPIVTECLSNKISLAVSISLLSYLLNAQQESVFYSKKGKLLKCVLFQMLLNVLLL